MKGNTLCEFIDDLLVSGGPEKEFEYEGKVYMLETTFDSKSELHEMVVFECTNQPTFLFQVRKKTLRECVEELESAPIFSGKTLYEVEQNITVLFG